jgi:hypothetical protein
MLPTNIVEPLIVIEKDRYHIPTELRREIEKMLIARAIGDCTDGDNVGPNARKYPTMPSNGGTRI